MSSYVVEIDDEVGEVYAQTDKGYYVEVKEPNGAITVAPADIEHVDVYVTKIGLVDEWVDEVGVVEIIETGPQGPEGPAVVPHEYLMPVAQTTATVDHGLGYDPVAIMVFVDGQVASDFSVTYIVPDQQFRVSFDVSVRALIRYI